MKSYFTKKVLQFQKEPHSETLKDELTSYCQLVIYTYPVTIKIIPPEDAADLLLYVSPRIETILRTFRYTNVPFESYMKKLAYLQAHSYNKMKRREARRFICDYMKHEDIEFFVNNQRTEAEPMMRNYHLYTNYLDKEDFMWSSETPVSLELKKKMKISAPTKKRLLHLILLNSEHLCATQITFLADFLDMKEIDLATMITQALELSDKRVTMHEDNKRIRDNHFFEKGFLEREKEYLVSIDAHPYYIERIDQKLEKEKNYFYKARDRMKKRPTTVTHSSVGKVTNVPKGTVDSGLQALYKYLYPLVDEIGEMG